MRGCLQLDGRAFGILIQPVQEKFPRPIKLERAGISADTRETARTKMAQVHGLDSKIIVLWSSQIYLRLVYKHATFGDFFFGFMVLLSVALHDRGNSPARCRQVNKLRTGDQTVCW